MNRRGFLTGAIAALLLIGAAVAWNVTIWSECRELHSWWYCVRVISK